MCLLWLFDYNFVGISTAKWCCRSVSLHQLSHKLQSLMLLLRILQESHVAVAVSAIVAGFLLSVLTGLLSFRSAVLTCSSYGGICCKNPKPAGRRCRCCRRRRSAWHHLSRVLDPTVPSSAASRSTADPDRHRRVSQRGPEVLVAQRRGTGL